MTNASERPLSLKEFDAELICRFGEISFETLVTSSLPRVRLKMGVESESGRRRTQVVNLASQILRYLFEGSSVWARTTVWDEDACEAMKRLEPYGYAKSSTSRSKMTKEGAIVHLDYWERFNVGSVSGILVALAGFDFGLEPRIDLKCYFVSLGSGIIVNLYDDRGMDVVAVTPRLLSGVMDAFPDLVLEVTNL